MVKGLVHGILEGNRRLRDNQAENIAVVAKAFKWSEDDARDELAHVHLSNLPENRAFFAGTIDSAGSFGGIFQSSVLAYGSVIKNPTDPARFVDTTSPRRARQAQPVRRAEDRHRADPHVDAGRARRRSAAQQGHPLLLRAELLEPRPQRAAEPGIPADHQALPAGEPGLHRAAARPRRQRARQRIPPVRAASSSCRAWRSRPWSCRVSAPWRCSDALLAKFPEIDKSRIEVRGPRLGRTHRRHRQRAEPPRRSAVVHDRVERAGSPSFAE